MGGGQFTAGDNQLKFTFDKDGKPMSAETVDSDGEVRRFAPETEWKPTQDDLASIKGDFHSALPSRAFAIAAGVWHIAKLPPLPLFPPN